MSRPITPLPSGEAERHTTALINALETDLTHYGPQSIIDVLIVLLEDREDKHDAADPVECARLARALAAIR